MACDTRKVPGQTIEQRRAEVTEAVQKLERAIAIGIAKVVVGPSGAITFKGWTNDRKVSDACAFRKLQAMNSEAFRRALARAEVTAGRKIDPRSIASGVHSHNGGGSWDPGHGGHHHD